VTVNETPANPATGCTDDPRSVRSERRSRSSLNPAAGLTFPSVGWFTFSSSINFQRLWTEQLNAKTNSILGNSASLSGVIGKTFNASGLMPKVDSSTWIAPFPSVIKPLLTAQRQMFAGIFDDVLPAIKRALPDNWHNVNLRRKNSWSAFIRATSC